MPRRPAGARGQRPRGEARRRGLNLVLCVLFSYYKYLNLARFHLLHHVQGIGSLALRRPLARLLPRARLLRAGLAARPEPPPGLIDGPLALRRLGLGVNGN